MFLCVCVCGLYVCVCACVRSPAPSLPHTQYILDQLFWPTTPLLEAVGQHEPQVEALRERLRYLIRQSLIPLEEYALQYTGYLDLMNLDIKAFVE